MWKTLHWQKDLMLEKGTFSKDDLAFNCQQRFIMRDLVAGQRTAELTEKDSGSTSPNCLPWPHPRRSSVPFYFQKKLLRWRSTQRLQLPAPSTSHPHHPRGVEPPLWSPKHDPWGKCLPDAYPRCLSEAALLSSSDEGSSSSMVVTASPPTQGPTDSSTGSRIIGFPHASGVSVGQSRCPIPRCAFVGGMEKMGRHALDDHLPWYVRPDLHCDQCQGLRFESESQQTEHTQQEHGNVPAGRLRESADNLSACLIFLATHLCDQDAASLYGLLRYVQLHQADHTLDIPILWGMSLSYVRPDLHCDQCQGLRFESESQQTEHTQQEHGNVPAGRLRESADNLSACLIFLATHLCDQDAASLYGLLRYVQLHQADHTLDIPILWGMSLSALDLIFLQSHQLPPLQLGSPLTALQSVACLLHWQVLLALATHLSMKEPDVLRCYLVSPPHYAASSPRTGTGAASTSAPAQRVQAARTAAAKAHQECQSQMLKGTPRALPEAAPLGCAFSHSDYLSDSHFHLHWLVKERLPSQINWSVDLEPSAIPLGTAVDSCLLEQSRRLPSTRATNSAVWLALGAHPNMAGKWNADERTEAIQELKARLLENAGRVVAIGEIGIDLSLDECTSAFEGRQVSFLQEFVSAIQEHEALRSHPLVLHIRDRSSKLKTAPTVCAQALVDAGVPRDHKIYWHCFTGTPKDAEKWLETFPNTLFGVSPRAITSRPEVTAFFGSAPLEQLLVETDSPKLQHAPRGWHGIAVRSPYHVGEVYKWLANLCNMGSVAVLSRTINQNYATFYNVPQPCWWREYVHVVFTKFARQFWYFGSGMFN